MKVTTRMLGLPYMVSLTKLYLPTEIVDEWSARDEQHVVNAMDLEWWIRGSVEWARKELELYRDDPHCAALEAAGWILWSKRGCKRRDAWRLRIRTLNDERRAALSDEWANR